MQSQQYSLEQCGHIVGWLTLQQQIWQLSNQSNLFFCQVICEEFIFRGDFQIILLQGSQYLWQVKEQFFRSKGWEVEFILIYRLIIYFNNKSMSQYRHSYSGYVNHILNKSPSKTTYSFSKSQRFPPTKNYDPPLESVQLQTNRNSYSRGSPSKQRYGQYPQEDPNKQHLFVPNYERNNFDVSRQVQKILKKVNRKNQDKSRSTHKNKTPSRYNVWQTNKNQYSPPKRTKDITQQKSPSPNSKSRSPNKSYFKCLVESQNPSRNVTITGYYPVGTELSPKGRYASSKIKNVVGAKFKPLPSSTNRLYSQPNDQSLGSGYYNSFSEFGYPHNQ